MPAVSKRKRSALDNLDKRKKVLITVPDPIDESSLPTEPETLVPEEEAYDPTDESSLPTESETLVPDNEAYDPDSRRVVFAAPDATSDRHLRPRYSGRSVTTQWRQRKRAKQRAIEEEVSG
ncbi:hypothetical protein BGZ73_005060 [Actinomortierella ambigua]|nr:hypothetical protein BGZ73_005060 [Actinomortierella ambigua]